MTAKSSRAAGTLTAYATGTARPAGANLAFTTGATMSNLVTVALGTAGQVTVTNGSTGITAITADVLGYFLAGTPTDTGAFTTVPSARILDTTTGLGAPLAPVAANGSLSFTAVGQGGVPASGAASVVLNVTAKASTGASTFTVYPAGASRPAGANQTFAAGATVSNLVTVAIGTSGQVTISNGSTGTTAFTADVLGYFLAGTPTDTGAFTTVPSARVLDTATGVGAPTAPIAAHGSLNVTVAGLGGRAAQWRGCRRAQPDGEGGDRERGLEGVRRWGGETSRTLPVVQRRPNRLRTSRGRACVQRKDHRQQQFGGHGGRER